MLGLTFGDKGLLAHRCILVLTSELRGTATLIFALIAVAMGPMPKFLAVDTPLYEHRGTVFLFEGGFAWVVSVLPGLYRALLDVGLIPLDPPLNDILYRFPP